VSAPAFVAALFMALSLELIAAPAAPEISKVEPFVWQVGATNVITIEGKELGTVRGLWTSRHGVLEDRQLNAIAGDDGNRLNLSFPIDTAEAAGPFALRVITDGGVSAPLMAMLEKLPELKVDDGKIAGERGWFSGSIKQAAGERFRVRLKRGQPLVMEVLAGRLGSKLDPVVRIMDGRGKELKFVQDTPGAGVDCGLRFNAPANGDYVIEIRDAQYRADSDLQFHLRYGINPGGQSVPWVVSPESRESGGIEGVILAEDLEDRLNVELANRPLTTVVINNQDFRHHLYDFLQLARASYRVKGFHSSGAPIPVDRTLPDGVSINSFLTEPGEVHRYTLTIDQPGPRRFTAMSRRLGGERDPVMRLKDASGKTLKTSHFFSHEAVLIHDFKEPGNHTLEVWDAAGQHGDFGGYHIRIELDPANFELNTETDSLRIPAGGEGELNVTIDRDGFDGPVKFELAHGPEGVELADAVTKEKAKEGKFKLKLAASLTPGTTFLLKISGRRGEGENAPKAPLYTSAYWKKRFPDLYSPMFEFEDTVWITVLPPEEKKPAETTPSP
jgi:hypothetical protein